MASRRPAILFPRQLGELSHGTRRRHSRGRHLDRTAERRVAGHEPIDELASALHHDDPTMFHERHGFAHLAYQFAVAATCIGHEDLIWVG